MPATPAFAIELTRFGLWRLIVLGLAGLTVAVSAAWLLSADEPPFVVATAIGGACVGAALSLVRRPACRLRWDGQTWWLGDAAGELSVALDFGAWMLLHFARQEGPRRSRSTWLPAQQRGLAGTWHALRCAVYSPRPAPGGSPAADSAAPSPE